jgi:hypothetical protein
MPKVTIQNGIIQPALETINRLMGQRFNATLHQRLNRNAKILQHELQVLAESVDKLNEGHWLLDEDGNKVPATQKVKGEDGVEREETIPDTFKIKEPEAYSKDFNALMAEEIDIDVRLIDPKFLDANKIQLSGREFATIEFMLKETEDDDGE